MSDEVLRDLVVRMATDPQFAERVRSKPGRRGSRARPSRPTRSRRSASWGAAAVRPDRPCWTPGWLCLAEGDAELAQELSQRVRSNKAGLIRLVSPMRTVAAGMLFAGAGMRAGIGQLNRLAAAAPTPVYAEVVRPLLAACEGMVDADPAAVEASLSAVGPEAIARLGGSGTEQDVVERCLLFALQSANGPPAGRADSCADPAPRRNVPGDQCSGRTVTKAVDLPGTAWQLRSCGGNRAKARQ